MPNEAFTANVFIIMGTIAAVMTKAGYFLRINMTMPTKPNADGKHSKHRQHNPVKRVQYAF